MEGGRKDRKGKRTLLRTSIMLTPEQRSKLTMLMQVTDADMSEILGKAIDVYYYYVKKYAEKEGLKDLVQLLEVAEKAKSFSQEKIDVEDLDEFIRSEITSKMKKGKSQKD